MTWSLIGDQIAMSLTRTAKTSIKVPEKYGTTSSSSVVRSTSFVFKS